MAGSLIGRLLGCDDKGRLMGRGVYHRGGPPRKLGACLFRLFRETYKGDLESMLQALWTRIQLDGTTWRNRTATATRAGRE